MDTFLTGFCDEVCGSLFTPMVKEAAGGRSTIRAIARRMERAQGRGKRVLSEAEKRGLKAGGKTTNRLTDKERHAWLAPHLAKKADVDAAGGPGLKKKLEALGLKKFKGPAGRLAGSTAGVAAFHKMVDPDVGVGQALGSGLALTGGGMAGEQIAKNLKMGVKGKTGLSVLGSILAMRALRNRSKKKAKDRKSARKAAREKMVEDMAVREEMRQAARAAKRG
jgi:hypothetical protein